MAKLFPWLQKSRRTGAAGEEIPTFKERVTALRNIPRMFKLIWQTSRSMTVANLLLRIVDAAVPLATLYVGKLIIDEIVRLFRENGGDMGHLWTLLAIELAIAILSDLVGRASPCWTACWATCLPTKFPSA